MSQAESDPTGFAAYATFLGTPLPENPIRALRILRYEAAREIERLIDFLDRLGGDPDLEDGADAEPTLGWPASGKAFGSEDGELEPSLGWTGTINQASRNRLGAIDPYLLDCEKDDADKEDNGDLEPSLAGGGFSHPSGYDVDLEADDSDREPDNDDSSDAQTDPAYAAKLRARRPPRKPVGFGNLTDLDGNPVTLVRPW